jgi:hypothetical protein
MSKSRSPSPHASSDEAPFTPGTGPGRTDDAPPDEGAPGYLPGSGPGGASQTSGYAATVPTTDPATVPAAPSDREHELLARIETLEQERAELTLKNADLSQTAQKAKALKAGDSLVLEQDEQFETVLLHRRRSAKPTGRFIPRANYRFAIPTASAAALARLAEEGATVGAGPDPATATVTIAPVVRALGLGERQPAFSLPPDVAKHALAALAVDEEVL